MALAEKDFKKIIALSTLSQLGFIISGLGLGCLTLSFFHLVTHAFFKSCIFVQVGGIILINNTSQDGRGYSFSGNLSISIILGIRCLSLCGFPFLSGFFSKDLVLLGILSPRIKIFIFIILIMGVFLTFLYSLRIILFSQVSVNSSQLKIIPSTQYFTSRFILLLLGIFSGSILFNSIFLPPLRILFLEKLIPLLYWVILFMTPYLLFKYLEQERGILIQDSLVLSPQKIIQIPLKSGEVSLFYMVHRLFNQRVIFSSFSIKVMGYPSLVLISLLFIFIIFSLGVKHIFLPKRRQ